MNRAAVLGRPVAHSLSPALHRAAYADLGLDGWSYDAADVGLQELPGWTDRLRDPGGGWRGLSLTMPLKRAVIPLLDVVSPLARAVESVNTVTPVPEGLRGDNTDVAGIVEAVHGAGRATVHRAVVLGAGATARSALAALGELGCREVVVGARSPSRTGDLAAAAARLGMVTRVHRLDGALTADLRAADLVISTLPAGAADDLAPLVADAGDLTGLLLDVVYATWPTVLAETWSAAGGRVVSGLEMLLHQAVVQVHLMTGLVPAVEAMRRAVHEELKVRAN